LICFARWRNYARRLIVDKETIFGIIKHIVFIIVLYGFIWAGGKVFADAVSDYEMITPKDGVECVVVSRMFNTSVDCWKD